MQEAGRNLGHRLAAELRSGTAASWQEALEPVRAEAERRLERPCALSDVGGDLELSPGLWLVYGPGPEADLEDLLGLAALGLELWTANRTREGLEIRLASLFSGYQEAEARWRMLLQLSKDLIFLVSAREGIVYVSPACTQVLGYAPEELQRPNAAIAILHPISHPTYRNFGQHFVRTGSFPEDVVQWCWIHKDGHLVYTENQFSNIRDENGTVTGFMTIARDITARKQTELEIARAEAFSRVMTAHLSPDGHWLKTPPRLLELLGYLDALPPWHQLLHPQDQATATERFREALAAQEVSFEIECRYARRNGGTTWIAASFSPVTGPSGTTGTLLVYLRDTTEERRTELALRDAHKLESLGVLAGGIAHDFNNLLTAILGNVTLAQLEEPPTTVAGPIHAIEKAAQRAADLTRQMLAYSGKGRFLAGPVNLHHLLREMGLLLAVSAGRRATLVQDLGPELPMVEADESQVQQLLLNLVTNASEALTDQSGVIAIRTRVVHLSEADARLSLAACPILAGPYVALSVSDTGCGITPEVMERIFDPFFSTKGRGRGLGLSVMLGILRGHHAGLTIQSKPGDGSEFTVYFPISATAHSATPRTRQRTILVADDIPAIRSVAERMLEASGYRVEQCEDGESVMQRLREKADLDLVLLDLTMPRLDGGQTLAAMRAEGFTMPVVICSGHDEREVRQQLGLPVQGFLQKPYRMEELRRVVETVLRRSHSSKS